MARLEEEGAPLLRQRRDACEGRLASWAEGRYFEHVVFDATNPQTIGRAWEAELGTETLTDEEAGFETRPSVPGGPELDLCFPRVPDEPTERPRLHLDVQAGELMALWLESADPARDLAFWQWLTSWEPVAGSEVRGLRHSSGRGPVLALVPEEEQKPGAKNRTHLDLRQESGDDADVVAAGIADRGGREIHFGWGDLPWRHFADPSGNEFCVLAARKG